MIINLEDPLGQYEATVELELNGDVWFTIDKLYRSDNPSFWAFLSPEFASRLGEALKDAAAQGTPAVIPGGAG